MAGLLPMEMPKDESHVHQPKLNVAFLSSGKAEFGKIDMTEFPSIEPPSPDSIHSSILIVEVHGNIQTLYD